MPFQIGHPNYFKGHTEISKRKLSIAQKGRVFSKEHKENLSLSHKGYVMPEEQRVKIGLSNKGKSYPKSLQTIERIRNAYMGWNDGEKSHLWRGGLTKLAKKIRQCRKYKEWRRNVYKRDGYICKRCKRVGGRLNADHIKQFALILMEHKIKTMEQAKECKELWDIRNGRTLCVSCHKKTKTYLKRLYEK